VSDHRPNVVFNIGPQQGNISNVAGDMTTYGGQHYLEGSAEAVQLELRNLRAALGAAGLDGSVLAQATRLVDDAEQKANDPRATAEKVAGPLERLARVLEGVGLLSVATAGVVTPLRRLAGILGKAGLGILALLA